MLNKLGIRELAYVTKILDTEKLDGYEKVHLVTIFGWKCVAPVSLQKGDLVIYFEVDSLLPHNDRRFAFLAKRKFRIKPIKICGVVSQGLVLPLASFPELNHCKEGDFVTEKLKVRLYEDPSPAEIPRSKSSAFTKAMDRHKKFFKFPPVKWMMRYKWFRSLCKFLFVKKKDKIAWPAWLPKTNSERVQNVPELFKHPEVKWVASEKVDGMSTSFVLTEKDEYMVCSHNVVVFSDKVKDSGKIADGNAYIKKNVWIEMSDKYDIKPKLIELKDKNKLKTVAIQGETYGDRIQRRTYGLRNDAHDLAVFHIWFDGKRLDMKQTLFLCDEMGLSHVGVYDWEMHMPSTVEELIEKVDSCKSFIDGGVIEGFVLYSQDGLQNYKCVSPNFLLKYHS